MSDPTGKKGKPGVRLPANLGGILSGNFGATRTDWRNSQKLIKGIVDSLAGDIQPVIKSAAMPTVKMLSPKSIKSLQANVMLIKFRLDPSSVDNRRGKKRACLTEDEVLLRASALDAFRLKNPAFIQHWIDKAVATQDPEVFKLLAQLAEESRTPSHTASSRRVTCALEAEIILLDRLERIPTKQEIRLESGMELEPSRWTEIHKAAGQAKNPAGKPKRGQARRGDNRRKTPPRN